MKRHILISICLLALVYNSFSQSNKYLQQNYGTYFVDIIQDNDFVWAISTNGIYKYLKTNAQLLAHYHCGNSGLITADFKCAVIDHNNVKWFGSADAGIIRYDNITWTVYNDTNSILNGKMIEAMTVDNNNLLWVLCTSNNFETNLFSFDGTNWVNRTYLFSNPLMSDLPTSISVDKENTIWICSFETVYRVQNNISTSYFLPYLGNSGMSVNSVVADTNNVKWFSNTNNALIRFDNSSWEFIKAADSNGYFTGFTNLSLDKNRNQIWLPSGLQPNMEFSGITNFDGQNFIHYNMLNNQFPFYQIQKVIVDQYNNKWVATALAGVIVFNENGLSLGIKNQVQNENFSIYPNPAKDFITIDFNNNYINHLSVFDIHGKEVISTDANQKEHSITVNVSSLSKGIYFVQIKTNNGIVNKKIIIKS